MLRPMTPVPMKARERGADIGEEEGRCGKGFQQTTALPRRDSKFACHVNLPPRFLRGRSGNLLGYRPGAAAPRCDGAATRKIGLTGHFQRRLSGNLLGYSA